MIAHPVRQALEFGERPEPTLGIFETILFTGGTAPLLDQQLARLVSSARQLYGTGPEPGDLRTEVPPGEGRLRIAFVPDRGTTISHGARGPDPSYDGIAPFVLPGGLGSHKWLDRRLLDAVACAAGSALPLLIDADGSVLESTRMNVLVEERGRLISPPADGRFREGFGRLRLRYDEEPVDLDRLLAADAVVLTSALRVVRLPLVS